ncbi:MAG: LuxR C-terminal-related transcriptional regulator [Bacteroidia bacterium]
MKNKRTGRRCQPLPPQKPIKDACRHALSPEQLKTLELWARGYSVNEIAAHEGLKPKGCRTRITTIRGLLEAENDSHMLYIALVLGLLSIP